MSNGRKARIKKLIEELHAKKNTDAAVNNRPPGSYQNLKSSKGSKQGGRYRPKV